MKKRLVVLDQNFEGGGAQRVLCTIMRALSPLDVDTHLVVVDALGEMGPQLPAHVAVHALHKRNTRKAFWAFVRLLWRVRPHKVFTTLGRTTVLAVLARCVAPRFELVARYPTMPSLEIAEGKLSGWRLTLQTALLRHVDVMIAQTDEMAAELQTIYAIPAGKVRTISNPIDKELIEDGIKASVEGLDRAHLNVLCLGRLSPEKGIDALLRAFAVVVESEPAFRLHLVGNGEDGYRRALDAQVESLNLSGQVTFHGFKSNPYAYINQSDMLVLSSRREGFPNVLLEAFYLGKPVVATRCVPVVDRLIKDGENGFVVDVDDVAGLAKAILAAKSIKGRGRLGGDTIDIFKAVLS